MNYDLFGLKMFEHSLHSNHKFEKKQSVSIVSFKICTQSSCKVLSQNLRRNMKRWCYLSNVILI